MERLVSNHMVLGHGIPYLYSHGADLPPSLVSVKASHRAQAQPREGRGPAAIPSNVLMQEPVSGAHLRV
jgi:hypothetical protein